jgi:uncharacterized RDD family membrane protein YckC
MTDESLLTAGVGRRLAAMVYDALLLVALLGIVTTLFLPFTGGKYVESGGPLVTNVYRLALVLVWIGFYGFFWTRGGQTLGMLAWRLKLVREDGHPLRWRDVLIRLAVGLPSLLLCGLGYFWIWRDRDGLAWHDRASRTRPIVLPKRKKS